MIRCSKALAAFIIAMGLQLGSRGFAAEGQVAGAAALLERLEDLEKRSRQLEAENAILRREIDAIRTTLHGETCCDGGAPEPVETIGGTNQPSDAPGKSAVSAADDDRESKGPAHLSGIGGQYRINGYVVDDDVGSASRAAARLRLRQNLDFAFNDRFSTHLQLELSHTTDNVTTTSESSRGANIDVRHAVLAYESGSGMVAKAGLLPISDRAFDTQFSSDWDYNPLAVSFELPVAAGNLRVVAANLDEGDETVDDDFLHFAIDYEIADGEHWLNLGGSLLNVSEPAKGARNHVVIGASGAIMLDDELKLSGFVSGSFTERELLAAGAGDGRGVAAGLRLEQADQWELLATHATGRRDGSGFLPVMALAQTYGYWGLTGILTVQGPTDTGFDADGVNLSNSGFGMTSIQARRYIPLDQDIKLTLAAGYFGNSRTPQQRSSFLGFDLLGMLSWRITDVLSLDAGVAYAHLDDGVVGYGNGVIGGAVFNEPLGVERDKIAVFTRLQAESNR